MIAAFKSRIDKYLVGVTDVLLIEMSPDPKAETQPNSSRVTAIRPEDPKAAESYFHSKLAFETDPSDVFMDLRNNSAEVIVVDARTQEAYAQGHVPGAINLPWQTIGSSTTASMPKSKVMVTYCDGIHCNASTKAALRLAALGFQVKEMLDGLQGWKREGYRVEKTVIQLSAR
jgi:rhodanese-related sulfurtransferase